MRFFGGRGGNADDNNHTNNSTGPSGNGNGNGHAAAHQPLLDRPNRLNRQISNISGVSYGSVVSRTTGPTGTGVPDGLTAPADGAPNGTANGHRRRSRSRSKRRRQKIRTSIYAEPPASYRKALLSYTLIVTLSSAIFLILFGVLKLVAWPHSLHPSPAREFLLAAGAWTVAFALRIPLFYISTLFGNYVNWLTLLISNFFQIFTQEALRLAILVLLQLHLRRPPEEVMRGHLVREDGDLDWAPLPDVWDPAFTQVWWMAMGWATVDVAVGIAQGYEQLSLYRDVLPHYHHHKRHHSHSHSQHQTQQRVHDGQQYSQQSRQQSRNQASSSSPPRQKRKLTKPGPGHYTDGAVSEDETRPFLTSRRETASSLPRMTATPLRTQGSALEPLTDIEQGPRAEHTEGVERPERVVVAASARDLEAELSNLITRKQRAELEEVYGTPLPRIPIFLIALQRLDSILLTLGLTLLISSAYLRAFYLPAIPTPSIPSVLSSTTSLSPSIFSSFSSALSSALSSLSPSLHSHASFSPISPISPLSTTPSITMASSAPNPNYEHEWQVDTHKLKDTTLPAFILVVLVHFFLTSLWMEALPRVGVHTVSYVGLLVSLAAFFAGLGYWGALV